MKDCSNPSPPGIYRTPVPDMFTSACLVICNQSGSVICCVESDAEIEHTKLFHLLTHTHLYHCDNPCVLACKEMAQKGLYASIAQQGTDMFADGMLSEGPPHIHHRGPQEKKLIVSLCRVAG